MEMYVVRSVMTAKPGQAGKMAKLMRKAFAGDDNVRVMTDFIAGFNTVVMETTVASLAEYEQSMADYKSGRIKMDPEVAAEFKDYNDWWLSGTREIYEVVE